MKGAGEPGADARARWLEAVARAAGGDPDHLLERESPGGLRVQLLHPPAEEGIEESFPGIPPYLRGSRASGAVPKGWDLRSLVHARTAAEAIPLIQSELEQGASSVWVELAEPEGLDRLAQAFAEERARLAFAPGTVASLDLLPSLPEGAGFEIELDPVGRAAGRGCDPRSRLGELREELVRSGAARSPALRLCASGLVYHEAGAGEVSELAAVTATAIAYLRLLHDAGLDAGEAARRVALRLAADTDIFATIAKLRAARRLWATITGALGVAARRPHLHVVTSARTLSRFDPWSNLLRSTLATLAAALGGADAITTLPFDHPAGGGDAHARRLARNTQLVLMLESRLHRVVDPAAGSGYLAALSGQIAEQAWRLVQDLEREGGILAALASGMLQDRIAAEFARRAEAFDRGRETLVGVSGFAHLEDLEERAEGTAARPARTTPAPLRPRRFAEPFEELRLRAERIRRRRGRRPRALACCLGEPRHFAGRLDLLRQILAAGGIETLDCTLREDAADAVRAFGRSGCDFAVLVGSDDAYRAMAAEALAALRAAGARKIFAVAADGAELSGVDGIIHEHMARAAFLGARLGEIEEAER